jgi:hypothetical protein
MKTLSVLSLALLFGVYSIAAPPYGNLFGTKHPVSKNQRGNFGYTFVRAHKLSRGTNIQ